MEAGHGRRLFPLYLNSTVAYADHNIVVSSFSHGEEGFFVQTPATDRKGALLRAFRLTKTKQIESVCDLPGTGGNDAFCRAVRVPAGRRKHEPPRVVRYRSAVDSVSFDMAREAA